MYDRNDAGFKAKLMAAVSAFYNIYFIPHMFLQTIDPGTGKPAPDLTKPEINIPTFLAVSTPLVASIWVAYGEATLDVLDLIYYWVSTRQDALKWGGPGKPTGVFGCCAETHPVTALM